MRRLDRYVLLAFLGPFAMLAGLIVALFVIIDLFGRFDEFLKLENTTVLFAIAQYYALVLPGILSEWLLPIITVISSLFAISSLDRHHEITAMMASGISRQRLLIPVLFATACISGGDYFLKSYLVPAVAPRLEIFNAQMDGDQEGGNLVYNVGISNRTADGYHFWFARYARRNEQTLHKVYLTRMDLQGNWVYRLQAKNAFRRGDAWVFNTVSIQKAGGSELPETFDQMEITSPITVESMLLHSKNPQHLTDSELRKFSSSKRLHTELVSRPATAITSFLLALWGMVILFFSRDGAFFIAVTRCVLMVVGYYALTWALLQFATYTSLSPVVTIYGPVLALLALGTHYYRKMPS